MKKNICFLFSGQIRKNSLKNDVSDDNILNSYKNIFNDAIKEKYNCDIFISTDIIDIDKTLNYFGKECVKNIHCSDNNFYLNPISSNIIDVNYYLDLYLKNIIPGQGYWIDTRAVYQFHRLYDCFNLVENYISIDNYDYIVRLRLDTVFCNNLLDYFEKLDFEKDVYLYGMQDYFAVGRSIIMKEYCTLIKKFGLYNKFHTKKYYNFKSNLIDTDHFYNEENKLQWSYSPEYQVFECLFDFCDKNNLDIDTSIKHCFTHMCTIYR